MLVLIGKTASGKSTILDALCKDGYKPLITYTSRPKRNKESKNAYHFIPEDKFLEKINEGFFAEWSSYNTIDGLWYYGSAKEDYLNSDNKTIIILNPQGLKSLLNMTDILVKSIYIYANRSTILKRLQKRGDKKEEAMRRIECDHEDFKGIEMYADKIIYNNLGTKIEDVVMKIKEFDKNNE